MKTNYFLIALLFFFGACHLAYSQQLPQITDVKIIPPNPTENDTVKIEVSSTHPYGAGVLNHSFGFATLHVYYCWDSTAVITNLIDTFSVGAALVAGTYNLSVILMVDTPCSPSLKTDTFDISFTVTQVNAIMDNQYRDSYTVSAYPNPTSGIFLVSGLRSTDYSLEIYNVLGERVYQSTVNSKQETVNLSGALKGIYFIKVISEETIHTQKIIIQ